jgi:hypothetical protein
VLNKKVLLKEYAASHRYFSLEEVVKAAGISVQLAKNYLRELKQEGLVFSAGRGIYSSIKDTFPLQENNRVKKIRQMIQREYPALDFIIWNTLAFQPYYHHQQTHNITFVEVEYDALHSICDRLSKDYRFVMIEKASRAPVKGFDITHDPIVVRLMTRNSPRQGHLASLEKMLVDLFVIKDKYSTMQASDYWEIWKSIDDFYRVNVTDIVTYAKTRRYFRDIVSQIIDRHIDREITFSAYLKFA